MTREEEIEKAAKECYYKCPYYLYNENEETIVDVFTEGAQWADKHPNTKDIWHDATEEPKEDMDILFISKNGKVNKVSKIDQTLYDWLKDNDGIDKWAYISDLLPKGGEK